MLFFELSLVFLFAYFLAVMASFFNVVIWRTSREESFIGGRSKCEHCQHQLGWQDNLPLLSYLLLGGKCRHCRQPIAVQLFTSELLAFASGWVFYALYLFSPDLQTLAPTQLIAYFLFFFTLAFVVWADLQYLLVPDFLVALLTVFALLLLFLTGSSWQLALFAVSFALVFLSSIYLLAKQALRKEALGLGDLKLMIPLALLLSWPLILVNLFLAFIGGGIFAMIVLLTGHKKFGQALPFAPFLVGAAVLSFFYGQVLLEWYLKILL